MRKNITAVILFGMILCALGGILSRCGREGRPAENGAALEERASFAPVTDTPEENAPAGFTESDCAGLRERLRPCILQIFCGDYRGSGVVWEITEKEVTVLTSAHLLKNGDTCEVLCHAGVYYEAKVDRISEECDIGFAVFPADALKEDGVRLTAAVPCTRGKEELVQGEELLVYGSMDFVAGDFVKGYLIEAECEMQIEGYEDTQPLLLGGIVRETGQPSAEGGTDAGMPEGGAGEPEPDSQGRGAVDAGMSGCGVFDGDGKLLGILAGGDGESGFAAVPVWRFGE